MQRLFVMGWPKMLIAYRDVTLKKAAIIGSCVTRDAFEFEPNVIDISGAYFPRASLVSIMSSPISIEHTILSSENQWLKWVVLNDYNKTTLAQVKSKRPEFIFIDLIEERYDLIKLGDSYLTRSDEFVKVNPLSKSPEYGSILGSTSDEATILFYEKAKLFCEKINSDFPDSIVIIHDARYSNYYRDGGMIKQFDVVRRHKNAIMNAKLLSHIDFLGRNISRVKKIRIDDEFSIANKEHKWGLSPFHYIDEYYLEFMREVKNIVNC